MKKLTVDQN